MKKVNQSQQKLLNYLDAFIESDRFQDVILKLRKEIGIPKNGLKFKGKENELYGYAFFVPKELLEKNKNRINILKTVNLGLKDLRKEFPTKDINISIFFNLYLFYNKKFYISPNVIPQDTNLCQVLDMLEFLEECRYPIEEGGAEFLKNSFEDMPIILKINPQMSQRDLMGYIKDHWALISAYLDRHKNIESKLGKIRTKNPAIKERNEFIYKNRNKPRAEISSLVSDSNFSKEIAEVDSGSVGKIISIERKRRKEV